MIDPDGMFWDDLLDYIEEGRVVPVVGPELVVVRDGSRDVALLHWVGDRLARQLRIPVEESPDGRDLNEVVARFVQGGGRRVDLYKRIHSLLKDAPLEPPQALLDLAAVDGFDLFVTLTFDALLSVAIDRIRYGGRSETATVAYAPSSVQDLAGARKSLVHPVVYHLFGRVSVAPDFVICDDDLLEFLYHLQDSATRPPLLFDELRESHLLILGCSFADWLARFFIRATKLNRLSMERDQKEWLVDSRSGGDPGLVTFLHAFSRDTEVLGIASPAEFCAQLARRWKERHPQRRAAATRPAERSIPAPPGAIFLSYASEDVDAVRTLAAAIEATGIDIWFDKGELQPGDDWDRKIRRGIEDAALFLPVISRATQTAENRRSYFWREWNLADDHARQMAPEEVFLVPVVIDDTSLDRATVPERFRKPQWTALAGGRPTTEFLDRVRSLYRAYHERQGAR